MGEMRNADKILVGKHSKRLGDERTERWGH